MGIQINGQTDTITATDGSFTIQGASGNLTGDLVGNVTGNLTGNLNSTGFSTFSGGLLVGTGTSISSPATNVLTLGTNNSERVRITSSGLVGIGTDNPDQKLEVYGGKIFIDGGGNRKITLDPGSNTTYDSRIDASHSLVFRSYVDAGAGVKTCTFDTNGDLDLTQGRNLKFASGNGIDFSATTNSSGTMTSELLSDYEEGTWTPVDNSAGLTLSTADGRYVKIGRIVHCWARIQYPSTANTNASSIGGFPYTNLWSSPVTYSGNISITDFNNTNILPMVENQNIQFRTFGNAAYNNSQLSGKFIYVEFRLFV